ncbi:MAG: ADP-ribosylglycohydrolase family protein, partial [Ruminococcaceae bacterium]|nr:ADP-ribosylglycohydrolase family protein [Oscillospiraceae bacterium]
RNAVSLGGDGDTQAAIAGSIAEAYYGIPDSLKNEAYKKFTAKIKSYYNMFYSFVL